MSNRKAASGPIATVKAVFANRDERCEVRWPVGADGTDFPIDDWRQVHNIDFNVDPVMGDEVLSVTRKNSRKLGVGPRRLNG